ncbi:MAG: hypothetical protein IJO40_04475, partial [Thermoguttaceae bacterium]|nr:hypothetical protein [Thermoguttaceae bacterium]
EENRRVAEGGSKSPESRQVPELKTIFYEFVPLNALEPLDDEENGATAELDAAFETETGGSSLTGSLSTPAGATGADGTFGAEDEYGATLDGTTGTIADGIFTSADGTTTFRPLTRKFGLSRRELDFETPIPGAEVAAVDDSLAEYEAAAEEGRAVSVFAATPARCKSTSFSRTFSRRPRRRRRTAASPRAARSRRSRGRFRS